MTSFKLPRTLANALLSQAQSSPEDEICGLISGRNGHAEHYYAIDNIASDTTRRYQMDPGKQIDAMRQMRDRDEELVAIYHSHPHAPATPSLTDISEAEYPETAYLIISLNTVGVLEITCFRIQNKQVREIPLELI